MLIWQRGAGKTVTPFARRLSGLVLSIAFLTYFLGPAFGAPWRISRYILVTILVLCASLSAWIIGLRMRRKIKRDLGRKATEADLASIDTWIKVDEVEEKKALE